MDPNEIKPTGADTSSALSQGVDLARNSQGAAGNPEVPVGAQVGQKVAPGKVIGEDGQVTNSDTRELLDAGLNVASLFTGGSTAAAKTAGTQAAKTAGTQAAKTAGAEAAKTAGKEATKSAAANTAKGAGAGNRNLLNQKPGGSNPIKGKAMEQLGGVIDKAEGKLADELEKNEAVKKFAADHKEEAKTINSAFNAVGSAASGDIDGVKENVKDLKKHGKNVVKEMWNKVPLLAKVKIIGGAASFLLFIILIFVVIFGPVEGGYIKLTEWLGLDGSNEKAWSAVSGAEKEIDEAMKAIVGNVPGWDSLSMNRKRILTAAALAVGTDYYGGGRPTNAKLDGISGGVDAGGLTEWLIWNISSGDPGYLTGSNIASSSLFVSISENDLLPGDFGVNGSDVGIYFGYGYWVHVDPSGGVIRGSYSGYTSFYKYKDIDSTPAAPGGGGGPIRPATGKLKDVFPDGVPTTKAGVEKYLVSISVPITKKSGQKTTTTIRLHKAIANDVKNALQRAQNAGFKVYEVQGFSWRNIANSSTISQHALGLAVDINVNENYCVYPNGSVDAGSFWDPSKSEYSIPRGGVLYNAFADIGWGWGGDWKSKKDYMHFSYTGG